MKARQKSKELPKTRLIRAKIELEIVLPEGQEVSSLPHCLVGKTVLDAMLFIRNAISEAERLFKMANEPGARKIEVPLACFHRYAYDLVFPKGVTGRGLIGVGGGKRGRL